MHKNIKDIKDENTTANCHTPQSVELNSSNSSFPVIALVGQPNSGKTTLFNSLTGSNFKTSNYPGATVEYSVGKLVNRFNFNALVIDSPGIISLTPNSPDEEVTVNALFNHPKFGLPDIVVVTADCTQLSRQLFLVKQVLDAGFKVVVALTMNDLMSKKSLSLDEKKLSEIMKCSVVKIDGRIGNGIDGLAAEIMKLHTDKKYNGYKKNIKKPVFPTEDSIKNLYKFTEETEHAVITHNGKNGREISELNKKIFKSLNREPDGNSIKLDKIFLHPVWGILIFLVSMGIIFTSIFWIAQPLMALIDSVFSIVSDSLSTALPQNTWYNDLITKGLINGVGSVLLFLPQIVILFLFLGILEDTGYLARAAMLIDKPLSKIGLNGRSFVPMISGYACAIPAIMAARTIPNRKERFLTIMIIPLMSCSARLPVYALLLAFVVPPDKAWIAGIGLGALYLFSLISGSLVAAVISKFKKSEEKSTFMLELPAYRKPVLKHIVKNTYYKSLIYVKKAGPTIVMISMVLWALTYFPNNNPELADEKTKTLSEEQISKLTESERLTHSYAAEFGTILEPVLRPLGWDWRVGVSLISAFAAREVFVSAMAITFSITDDDEDNMQSSILQSMREAKIQDTGQPLFTTASVIALIIYFMFAMQCLSTVVVGKKETGSWKIPMLQIFVYTTAAYILAFIAYNGLHLLGIS
ncbi:MAG: ferrous iron transport protein B [Ignavibacteriae bacterium]|nr:MAG: ferrous iron transport protein B [Ignavibacteriota bacterium]